MSVQVLVKVTKSPALPGKLVVSDPNHSHIATDTRTWNAPTQAIREVYGVETPISVVGLPLGQYHITI